MHALSSIPRGYPHMARASRTELDERRSWLPEPSEPRSLCNGVATRSIVLLLLGSAIVFLVEPPARSRVGQGATIGAAASG